ncbi:MAG: SRPBCC family protein [Saprospiraceae bacterium]
MKLTVHIDSVFNCSLERAFKTPMLCDVALVHTGYGLMPRITHSTEDEEWGRPGGSKKVFAAASLTFAGGEASTDTVIERVENKYWKIEVSDFQSWMLGFNRFVGEWNCTELEPNKILIDYTYTLHADTAWLYPLNWLFANLFWKTYMKRVLENIRKMAYDKEPYLYS